MLSGENNFAVKFFLILLYSINGRANTLPVFSWSACKFASSMKCQDCWDWRHPCYGLMLGTDCRVSAVLLCKNTVSITLYETKILFKLSYQEIWKLEALMPAYKAFWWRFLLACWRYLFEDLTVNEQDNSIFCFSFSDHLKSLKFASESWMLMQKVVIWIGIWEIWLIYF